MPQESITTAVDSLVKFVNENKRVSLTDASTKLKIPETILSEWAAFLEQEGILEIEYKFTTPFLIAKGAKQLSKEEVDNFIEQLKGCLEFVQSQSIKSKSGVKNEKDVKDIIAKFKKDKADECDVVYAQKFYLEKALKKAIELLKKNQISKEEVQDLLKKHEIFRKKVRTLK